VARDRKSPDNWFVRGLYAMSRNKVYSLGSGVRALQNLFDLADKHKNPSGIRFSHITLRGPYTKKLPASWLRQKNKAVRAERFVRLTHPGEFFSFGQCTVFIEAELKSLTRLLHKPDFPDTIPHLTIYDGKDHAFAEQLFSMLQNYEWNIDVEVSDVRLIEPKVRPNEVLIGSFVAFFKLFEKYVGRMENISSVYLMAAEERLALIRKVLDGTLDSLASERSAS
jgi:hypothetical protein